MAILEAIPERWIVIAVVILITFLQLTANFYVMGPALGGWTTWKAQKILALLNTSLISLYINYYLACTTDPGHSPKEWEPPSFILENNEDRVGFSGPRYCKKCDQYKPPRSHHCKHCGQCVLKMDHHCPWIGNCVGFANYPHFVRFVYSVVVCCSYGCFLMLWRMQRIIDIWNNRWDPIQPGYMEVVAVLTVFILAGLVNMLVGTLAIYHTYCLIKGQTTIEGSERTKTRRLIRRRKIDKVEFPYDIGFYENICSILGNNPLLWMWPQPAPGNGLDFATKPGTDPYVVYAWPPRDPKDLGQAIFEQQQEPTYHGPQLVRRDSEGYLVREITMEDRMRMLQEEYMYENDNRDYLKSEAHQQFVEEYQHNEGNSDQYNYYDEDEDGQFIDEDGYIDNEDHNEQQVAEEEVIDDDDKLENKE